MENQPLKTDVLLVTVTKAETQAVLSAAEKQCSIKPKTQFVGNKTYYDLGNMGNVNVLLVRSEMGSGGPAGSFSTVKEAIQATSPKYVIMVGIAFGIDENKQSIGDILVSQHLQEYELQKVGAANITPRGERVPCSSLLLDRFRDGELSWDKSKVSFGLVLSGLKLIDNIEFRNDLLDHWPEAIGGEMEGTGLYSASHNEKVDWILVKAICDWAHKKGEDKEKRQLIAAENAANYVISVIKKGGLGAENGSTTLATRINTVVSTSQKHKNIIIAHSNADQEIVNLLRDNLNKHFGLENIFINTFELDNGNDLASIFLETIRSDNWFILIGTNSSAKSKWINFDARLLTLLSLEAERYNILTLKIDKSDFPGDLDIELRRRKYIEVGDNIQFAINEIAKIIQAGQRIQLEKEEFFVNRGPELDRLEVEATRQKIIYITGVAGIGKASLVRTAARTKFHRDLITINIRVGHNLELLAREIISKCDLPQPIGGFSELDIAYKAVDAVVQRVSNDSILFINNAQNAMDTEGVLRTYFRSFLKLCIDANISFPVIIATTRKTEILPDDDHRTVSIRIPELKDDFMVMTVKHWLSISQINKTNKIKDSELIELVSNFQGYPIAAKMLGGALAYENPRNLLQSQAVPKFQRMIAEHIVSSILSIMDETDKLILQALSIVGTGITTQQLLGIRMINVIGVDAIQASIQKLSTLMLLTQKVDSLVLHPTISTYFVDQAIKKAHFKPIASDLADMLWKEVSVLLRKLDEIRKMDRKPENINYVNLNKSLLQSIEPAHRLLLMTGQADKTRNLPFQLSGHLRELAISMYQQVRDYKACIEFSTAWLKIEPKDADIKLYLARAYRQSRQYAQANRLLEQLERDENNFVRAKVLRERGMISEQEGDLSQAIQYYRNGRLKRADGRLYYPQVNANLAIALVAQADQSLLDDKERQKKYSEAIAYFTEAREFIPRFDENYLDSYVNAQLNAGRLTEKNAIKMLEEALQSQYENPKLSYRLAEILSNDPARIDDALEYAEEARELGHRNAILTIAKIQIAQGKYPKALKTLSDFNPEKPREHLIFDVLRAKALHDDPDEARKALDKHADVENNSFLAHERVQVEIYAVEKALYSKNVRDARDLLASAENLLKKYENKFRAEIFALQREQIEKLSKRL